MSRRSIIIGDIHGCSKALDELLEKIQPGENDRLILLGDLFDRGPDSWGVFETVKALKKKFKERFVLLRGNHEDYLLQEKLTLHQRLIWERVGRGTTVKSFREHGGRMEEAAPWLKEHCRLFYRCDGFQCVHAGLKVDPLEVNDTYTMVHDHDVVFLNRYAGLLTVVGHVAMEKATWFAGDGETVKEVEYEEWKMLPEKGTICIDTGCGKGGCLTAMEISDNLEFGNDAGAGRSFDSAQDDKVIQQYGRSDVMKRIIQLWVLLCFLFLAGNARAELSVNLRVKTELNPDNNRTASETYVDDEGNPVVAGDKGYATIRYTYGTGNVVIREEFLDERGIPVNSTEGYSIKTRRYTLGRVTETCYYDRDNHPVTGPEGFARQETVYHARRHISTWDYDTKGNPIGVHHLTEYGKDNRMTAEAWYDTENNPVNNPDGYARVEYEYFGREKSKVSYYTADGKLFYHPREKYARMESVYQGGKIRSTHYYGSEGELTAGPKGYAYVLYTYGNYTTEMYYNADGSPYYNNIGVCGIARTPLKHGKTTEYYLVDEGVTGSCSDGYSMTKIEYSKGRIAKQGYYDDNNRLMVVPKLGYAQIINYYQSAGVYRTFYYGTDGRPMAGPNGYAMAENNYTNRKLTARTFYGTDKKTKVSCTEGYAQVRYEYRDGNVTNEKYYGTDGKAFPVEGLYDEIRYEWEEKQKTAESYWLGGQPANGKDGYHEVRTEYAGRKIRNQSYYDTEGKMTACADGYARMEKLYNSQGGAMKTLYYDTAGNLINTPKQEYAYVLTIPERDRVLLAAETEEGEDGVDGKADETEDGEESLTGTIYIEYYGTDGKLMNLKSGYARLIRKTDAGGRVLSEAYYNREGRKAALKAGYDEVRNAFGEGSQPIRTEYFRDGKPAACEQGYAAVERELDHNGRAQEERYYDETARPVKGPDGCEVVRWEYNARGQETLEQYLDAEGKPVKNGKGVCRTAYTYDGNGKKTGEAYYDGEGLPMACENGYAAIERQYNSAGVLESTRYFDTSGRMMNAPGREYAYTVAETDENGRTVGEAYYDTEGQKTVIRAGHDEYRQVWQDGRIVRIEYYLGGQPVQTGNGYAAIERDYDEDGNIIEERYFDKAFRPAVSNAGYEVIRKKYNENRRVTEEKYLDHTGQPMMNAKGVCRTIYEYTEEGRIKRTAYCDGEGNPMACTDGYAAMERLYSKEGREKAILYYDENGELTRTGRREYAYEMTTALDRNEENGEELLKVEYYGTDKKLMNLSTGYARIERKTDGQGQVLSEKWFDKDGQRVWHAEGYAEVEREYDGKGNMTEERYYDKEHRPTACSRGYVAVKREYNEKRRVIKEAYFDQDGRPMADNRGVYWVEIVYDEEGRSQRAEHREAE